MSGAVFSGVRERWRPLYEQLRQQAAAVLGPFEEHHTTSSILWKHGSTFAEIRAKQDCLVVAFPSDQIHEDWQPVKVQQTSKNRFAHSFQVTDDSGFDLLLQRLGAAYTLTKPDKPRPQRGPKTEYKTVDEYIATFDPAVQEALRQVRQVIRNAAPDAEEVISWQMPTYRQGENLVHFAAQKSHLGFYPSPAGIEAFAHRLDGYKTTKGGVKFPLAKPIPLDLIDEITRFRVAQVTKDK